MFILYSTLCEIIYKNFTITEGWYLGSLIVLSVIMLIVSMCWYGKKDLSL